MKATARQKRALRLAIKKAGTQEALAEKIGVNQQRISWWVTREKPVPGEYVLPIEDATGVPRGELREDLYPARVNRSEARA